MTTSSSRALTASVSSAPTAEAAAPVSEIHAAARMSTSPARWYVNAPTAAVGRITGSGVATATMGDRPPSAVSPGVITMPPPIPNRPDRTPAASPTSTVRTASSGVTGPSSTTGRPIPERPES